jgi:hypothetical protein
MAAVMAVAAAADAVAYIRVLPRATLPMSIPAIQLSTKIQQPTLLQQGVLLQHLLGKIGGQTWTCHTSNAIG